jgi:hypothetical protein
MTAGRRVAFVLPALMGAATLAAISGCGGAGAFCAPRGQGSTASAAMAAYVRECGSDYSLSGRPRNEDALRATTPYPHYSHLTQYTLSVKNNDEGSVEFALVGEPTPRSAWRTLEVGTGP